MLSHRLALVAVHMSRSLRWTHDKLRQSYKLSLYPVHCRCGGEMQQRTPPLSSRPGQTPAAPLRRSTQAAPQPMVRRAPTQTAGACGRSPATPRSRCPDRHVLSIRLQHHSCCMACHFGLCDLEPGWIWPAGHTTGSRVAADLGERHQPHRQHGEPLWQPDP
jgi:hypothetical protein